jgi:hypothetical protein
MTRNPVPPAASWSILDKLKTKKGAFFIQNNKNDCGFHAPAAMGFRPPAVRAGGFHLSAAQKLGLSPAPSPKNRPRQSKPAACHELPRCITIRQSLCPAPKQAFQYLMRTNDSSYEIQTKYNDDDGLPLCRSFDRCN